MQMRKPHEILTDLEEIERRKKIGELFMPLTDEEARACEPMSAAKRNTFLQERLDSIRNYGKAHIPREPPTCTQPEEKSAMPSERPDLPTPAEVFGALAPIMKALPVIPSTLEDDAVLAWSKDQLRVGDVRELRRVYKQALDATEPDDAD